MAPTTTVSKQPKPGKPQRPAVFAPFAPLFVVLNWVALVGWAYVLVQLIIILGIHNDDRPALSSLELLVSGLEAICLIEVLRIMVGDLPGNLVLGVVLHAIRVTVLKLVWDPLPWTGPAIYVSWALTEVTRYPMYVFPNVAALRSLRMVVPLITFPLGAFAEAYATYHTYKQGKSNNSIEWWQEGLFMWVLFVNGVLGPFMAYPALLKKGLPVLGLGKKKKETTKKKE